MILPDLDRDPSPFQGFLPAGPRPAAVGMTVLVYPSDKFVIAMTRSNDRGDLPVGRHS